MWNKIQNWLMNVLAKWIWIIIMFPIRAFIGLCIAVSKHMPETLFTREFFEIKVTSKFLDSSIAAVIPAAPLPMMSTSVLINFFEN